MGWMEALGGILKPLAEGIDAVSTSAEEKGELKVKMAEVQNALAQSGMAMEAQIANAQRDLLTADVQAGSILARNVRPFCGLLLVLTIVYKYISPTFGAPQIDFPTEFWYFAGALITVHFGSRGAEKLIQTARVAGDPALPFEEKAAFKQSRRMLKLKKKIAMAAAKSGVDLSALFGKEDES